LDRRLLPGPRTTLATFNTKDFADYAEHDALLLI
jgi:hypothetical protein